MARIAIISYAEDEYNLDDVENMTVAEQKIRDISDQLVN